MKIRMLCLLLTCLLLSGCVATNAQNVRAETAGEEAREMTEAEAPTPEKSEKTTHGSITRPNDDLPEELPTQDDRPEITVPTRPTVPAAEQSVTEETENADA